ncbi:ATP-binding cassette domain-containing protein [Caldifermentibacillus hisashii]|jgi:bacitracin transport system ATP-binding protein|uniref:ATP-binding cassette domain-containing protein n=1 Tax=Caldifermentibacillus hisashii TaxID=996558 RepID=UPI00156B5D0D|nr:ABC transporter ATP-binding protein [Caldifermentibacillus hisashii]
MTYVLQTKGLTKKDRTNILVDHVNLNVQRNEIYGLFGGDDSGKSSILQMIMGLISPTSGEIKLFGNSTSKKAYNLFERIGYMGNELGFSPNLTLYENLELHRRLMGVLDKNSVFESLKMIELDNMIDTRYSSLTLGMRQRLGIARALLHRPELLLLDDPLNGLDSVESKTVLLLFQQLTSTKNVTIVLTSHSVNDLQGIATHIGILDRGKLLKVVDRNELLQKTRQFLKLRVDDVKKASFLLEQNLQITDYKVLEDDTLLIYEQSEHAAAIARTLITNNLEVSELTISKSSIEDYIVKLKNEGSY